MWDCARLTTRPTRLDFRAAPHGPFSKRVTKAMGSQQRSLNACCGPLSSRHAPARSWWSTSRKSPSVSMVGAGNNNSDLPFACPTPSPHFRSAHSPSRPDTLAQEGSSTAKAFLRALAVAFHRSPTSLPPRPSKAPRPPKKVIAPGRFSLGEGGHGGLAFSRCSCRRAWLFLAPIGCTVVALRTCQTASGEVDVIPAAAVTTIPKLRFSPANRRARSVGASACRLQAV
jgi:hypothetical protein